MASLHDEEYNPSLKRTFRIIKESVKLFIVLVIPVILGIYFFQAIGALVGMALGGILMMLYLDYTGKF